jgi:hypothetical protein
VASAGWPWSRGADISQQEAKLSGQAGVGYADLAVWMIR